MKAIIFLNSIYTVHDDAKDKEFELELSWITNETKRHEFVPKDIANEAERLAKVFIPYYYYFVYIYILLTINFNSLRIHLMKKWKIKIILYKFYYFIVIYKNKVLLISLYGLRINLKYK